MLLLIDNFDSFTYNLVEDFRALGVEVCVKRNDALSVKECLDLAPSHIVISPGPGTPNEAGISKELIALCPFPLLGVCLGHQCLAEVFGAKVVKKTPPMHGKTSRIQHNGKGIFFQLPQNFEATRYHSLTVDKETLPPALEITALSEDGEIMGLKSNHLQGVQFHPESLLTEMGSNLLHNFLKIHEENRLCYA